MPTLPLSSLNCQTSPFITTDVFLYHQDRSPSFQTTLWNCLPLCPEYIQSLSACTITSPGTRLLGACRSSGEVARTCPSESLCFRTAGAHDTPTQYSVQSILSFHSQPKGRSIFSFSAEFLNYKRNSLL